MFQFSLNYLQVASGTWKNQRHWSTVVFIVCGLVVGGEVPEDGLT